MKLQWFTFIAFNKCNYIWCTRRENKKKEMREMCLLCADTFKFSRGTTAINLKSVMYYMI